MLNKYFRGMLDKKRTRTREEQVAVSYPSDHVCQRFQAIINDQTELDELCSLIYKEIKIENG
jgi:hypothetical protein